jgi:hypothetical protein
MVDDALSRDFVARVTDPKLPRRQKTRASPQKEAACWMDYFGSFHLSQIILAFNIASSGFFTLRRLGTKPEPL